MKHTITGKYIIFHEVVHDEFAENPLQFCDGFGEIISFNRRHINSKSPDEVEMDEDTVGLSYYEHSGCLWFVPGTKTVCDMRWDGVARAGVWKPDSALLSEAKNLKGEARRKKMLEWAEQACEVYTAWCNGEVYEYRVEVFELKRLGDQPIIERHYYEDDKPLLEDSCCGLYGHAGETDAQNSIKAAIDKYREEEHVTVDNR